MCKNGSINGDMKLAQLLAELAEFSWDFLCIGETRAADADFPVDGGHRLMCSRGEFKYSGVAILVHYRWIDQIKAFVVWNTGKICNNSWIGRNGSSSIFETIGKRIFHVYINKVTSLSNKAIDTC